MSSRLAKRIVDACAAPQAVPVSADGLSALEQQAAGLVNGLIERLNKCAPVSDGFLQTLSGTEDFCERMLRVLSAIVLVNRLVETDRDLSVICKRIVDIVAHELQFENCSIMLADDDHKKLVLVAGAGKGDEYRQARPRKKKTVINIDEGVAGRAYSTGRPVYVSDVEADGFYRALDMEVNIRTLLSVPIRAGEEMTGVMNFSHPMSDLYDQNLEHLMVILADFVGHVITLIRLYISLEHWNLMLKEEVTRKTTELTRKNRQLSKIALYDSLTGIYNRRFFFKRLEEEFTRYSRHGEPFGVLFMDIDNLKLINDTYGHVTGDRVIKAFARILKDAGRKGDVVCRIGGDEFGCMLLDTDEAGAVQFAARIRELFSGKTIKGYPDRPSVSVGIVFASVKKFRDYRELYAAADNALHDAKRKRDSVCLYAVKKGR